MTTMKRRFLFFLACIGWCFGTTAHPVDLATAKSIAAHFMNTDNVLLSATYRTEGLNPALYVFNTDDGFVIIAADDNETPIVAYSHEGPFHPENIPDPVAAYLQDAVARVQYAAAHPSVIPQTTTKFSRAVPPLVTAKWHQGCGYNSLCPAGQGPCEHAEVGCVAVAMGQIMHYWGYPSTGWGTHSYTYGSHLSADFGNTTYQWDLMPDSLTTQSSPEAVEAVATLLFHCGVSVNMRYDPSSSSASVDKIPEALIQYFNYSRQLHMEIRSYYDDATWIAMLKECLDKRQPILYSGFGNAGHSFVCDGYDENDLFHFNWGWGGNANGYFSIGSLNPNGYQFNNTNFALLDILPQYDPCQVEVSVFPPASGDVEGTGAYHYGAPCTLIAKPAAGFTFHGWKRDGETVNEGDSYTFTVRDDINIEADFSFIPIGQITASIDPDSANASLSWAPEDNGWKLLNKYGINGETSGVVTDGEFIYIAYAAWSTPPNMIEQYTMDGVLVDAFDLDGLSDVFTLAYDGTDFYCNSLEQSNALSILYRIDLEHKTILDSILMDTWFETITYDPDYDGFWLGHDKQTLLYDRMNHKIQSSPYINDYLYGTGITTANDGSSHLLMVRDFGVYDYDIALNSIRNYPLPLEEPVIAPGFGACTGKYDDKEALFFVLDSTLYVYEINHTLPPHIQIVHYRIYRTDLSGNNLMLADEVTDFAYLDTTWKNLPVGQYRYGICSVFADGSESEPIWSNPLVKTDHGVVENNSDQMCIYPNPVHDKLIVEHQLPIRQCELFTVDGTSVFSASPSDRRIEIPTQGWSSGTYILRITTDNAVDTKQVIKFKE